jgi:hypothetical protein
MADPGGTREAAHLPSSPHFLDAACRQPGVELAWFFQAQGEATGPAKKICTGCPINSTADSSP